MADPSTDAACFAPPLSYRPAETLAIVKALGLGLSWAHSYGAPTLGCESQADVAQQAEHSHGKRAA